MIWSIVVGLVVGLLARAIKPGTDSMGWIFTIILGMIGASVGGFLASIIGIQANGDIGSLIISVIGAIIVLFVYEFITGRGRS